MASKPTTCSFSATSTILRPRTLVETSKDVDRYYGSWFTGKIVHCLRGDKFVMEYDKIMQDKEGTKDPQETAKLSQLRPIPPNEIIQDFQVGDKVDVYDNNEWCKGRISESFWGGMWAVYFKDWSEQQAYSDKELRRHHKWVNGSWMTPFPQQVCNDEDGFKARPTDVVDEFKILDKMGAYYKDGWWVGVVSKVLGDSKYIIYFINSNEE
ncbi:protein AGENET DOMAIN (AGD)-CONTAINING P1-like [Lathyrus oleraceus]|uniref:protein AGENET DOMAIN (AGD)-CONTAINING P1-like n=1 Tax=Pisum sativum TaxID=3888 RepID=UPI0021D0DF96|nr:protein AGENET DOMAIN (AGD)-CONTAINING P1-like [Pisum sativum]